MEGNYIRGGGGSFINKMAVDVSKTISDDEHGYVLIQRVSPETHDTLSTKDETPVDGGGVHAYATVHNVPHPHDDIYI